VKNTNFHPILYRYPVIVQYCIANCRQSCLSDCWC